LTGESGARLERGARLEPNGRDPIQASRMQVGRDGPGTEMLFFFPRELSNQDKSSKFQLDMDRSAIKHKFDLRKMVYQGELAL
jgi:hypothetical protein